MTARPSLLLWVLLAPRAASAQAAPAETSAADQARVDKAMPEAVATQRSLRPYPATACCETAARKWAPRVG